MIAAGRSAPTKADGIEPGLDQQVDEPAGGRALAVRAGDGDQRPSRRAASATTCCHGSSGIPAARAAAELRVVGVDRGQRLGDGQPRRAQVAPSRGAGSWRQAVTMPAASSAAVYGDGPPASQPVTVAPAPGGEERGRARAGAGRADDVDPLPGPDRVGRSRAGARPAPMAAASRVT